MASSYDRRTFLGRGLKTAAGAAVLGGGAVLLDACGSSGSTTPASSGSAVSNLPPKRGGTLRLGVESEINSLDPSQGRWDPTGYLYAGTVFDPLAGIDDQGRIQPYLAKAITPNADYTAWTVTLRPGISFHDGTPFDASVAKLNLDSRRSSFLVGPSLLPVADVTVQDPMTVVISLHQPWIPFPFNLAAQGGHMIAPAMLHSPDGGTHPIGTGPFVFEEWVNGDHFSVKRNPRYWRQGLPYLDGITFHQVVEQTASQNAINGGSVDLLATGYPQIIQDARSSSTLSSIDSSKTTVGEQGLDFIMLNLDKAPMNDIRVRQALAYATDQQKISNVVTNGLFPPRDGLFVPGSPYYAPSTYPRYDPAKARQLVAEVQRDSGPISFEFGTINTTVTLEANQLLQQMWQSVGIQSHIVQFEETTYILNALQGNYQAYAFSLFDATDPDNNYVWLSTTTAAPIGQSALNFSRNRDPQVEAALQSGRRSSDPSVRAQAYKTVNERLNTDLPFIWLFQSIGAVVGRPNVMNYGNPVLPDGGKQIPYLNGVFDTVQIWLNQ